jgi:hypothetical protein
MKSSKQSCQIAFFIYLFIFSFLLVPFGHSESAFAEIIPIMPQESHSKQCIQIISALEQYHYLGKKNCN